MARTSGAARNITLGAILTIGAGFTAVASYLALSRIGFGGDDDVTPLLLSGSATVAPGGSGVAFIIGGYSGPEALHRALFLYNPEADTNPVKPFLRTEDLLMGMPTWSPDGKRLLIKLARTRGYYTWLLLVDVGSGEISTLAEGTEHLYWPKWSPDGRYVAFMNQAGTTDGFQELDVVLVDAKSGDLVHRVSQSFSWDSWAWGDSGSILYSPDGELKALDVETGEKWEVASGMGFELAGIAAARHRGLSRISSSPRGAILSYDYGVYLVKRRDSSWHVIRLHRPEDGFYCPLPRAAWNADGSEAAVFTRETWAGTTELSLVSAEGVQGKRRLEMWPPTSFGFMGANKLLCFSAGDAIAIDVDTGEREELLKLRHGDIYQLFEEAKKLPALKPPFD